MIYLRIDLVDLTDQVQDAGTKSAIRNGVVHVFASQVTGTLILTENDYALNSDIKIFLEDCCSEARRILEPPNAHSHLRSMLLPLDKTLPVIDGRVQFEIWQSLLFVETDAYPRKRRVIMQVIGDQ